MLTITKKPAPRKRGGKTKGKSGMRGSQGSTLGNATPWDRIRSEYLIEGLREDRAEKGTPSLKVLATKYEVSYGTIRNRASREDWPGELDKRISEREKMRVDMVQNIQVVNEVS